MDAGVESLRNIYVFYRQVSMCAAKTSFGRWSAKERGAVSKKTNAAIKKGILPPPSDFVCQICGRGKEEAYRIEYHHETYDDPLRDLVPLCNACHSKFHRQRNRQIREGSAPRIS